MATPLLTHRFSVEDFHRMVGAGILTKDDRVELIEGDIIHMAAMGPAHAACVRALTTLFGRRLGDRALVSVQLALDVNERSELFPDLALIKPRTDYYAHHHPIADDVLLLIEVSDTILEYDRGQKLALYAEAGIPEVWIVDLEHAQVESHREPSQGLYRTIHLHRRGDRLEPTTLPGLAIAVNDILL